MIPFDPNGAAMDMLHACYSTLIRPFKDSDYTEWITWYFVDDDLPHDPLPFQTTFGSRMYAHWDMPWPKPGEVEGALRPFSPGRRPYRFAVPGPAGPAVFFRDGASWADRGTLVRAANGLPEACAGTPLGILIGGAGVFFGDLAGILIGGEGTFGFIDAGEGGGAANGGALPIGTAASGEGGGACDGSALPIGTAPSDGGAVGDGSATPSGTAASGEGGGMSDGTSPASGTASSGDGGGSADGTAPARLTAPAGDGGGAGDGSAPSLGTGASGDGGGAADGTGLPSGTAMSGEGGGAADGSSPAIVGHPAGDGGGLGDGTAPALGTSVSGDGGGCGDGGTVVLLLLPAGGGGGGGDGAADVVLLLPAGEGGAAGDGDAPGAFIHVAGDGGGAGDGTAPAIPGITPSTTCAGALTLTFGQTYSFSIVGSGTHWFKCAVTSGTQYHGTCTLSGGTGGTFGGQRGVCPSVSDESFWMRTTSGCTAHTASGSGTLYVIVFNSAGTLNYTFSVDTGPC